MDRLYLCIRDLDLSIAYKEDIESKSFEIEFQLAMDDDFNTPKALAVLFDMVKKINLYKTDGNIDKAANVGLLLVKLAGILVCYSNLAMNILLQM